MNIKIGDVVRLKSGGPDMTVTNILEKDNLLCTWYCNLIGSYKISAFSIEILKKVSKG